MFSADDVSASSRQAIVFSDAIAAMSRPCRARCGRSVAVMGLPTALQAVAQTVTTMPKCPMGRASPVIDSHGVCQRNPGNCFHFSRRHTLASAGETPGKHAHGLAGGAGTRMPPDTKRCAWRPRLSQRAAIGDRSTGAAIQRVGKDGKVRKLPKRPEPLELRLPLGEAGEGKLPIARSLVRLRQIAPPPFPWLIWLEFPSDHRSSVAGKLRGIDISENFFSSAFPNRVDAALARRFIVCGMVCRD